MSHHRPYASRGYRAMAFALALFAPIVSSAAEQALTERTGQEILKELRAIHEALEKRPLAPAAEPARSVPPQRVKVPVNSGYTLGNENAPVTVVEFTDYQCPYCRRFFDNVFPDIKKNYIDTGKVRFISRNLPLNLHENAKKAAHGAFCAGDQGKYWEMRNELFRNNRALQAEKLPSYAQALGLDLSKFKACLASDLHVDKIDEDMKSATSAGISGTPSFVIGREVSDGMLEGEKIVGAQPYSAFELKINALLK